MFPAVLHRTLRSELGHNSNQTVKGLRSLLLGGKLFSYCFPSVHMYCRPYASAFGMSWHVLSVGVMAVLATCCQSMSKSMRVCHCMSKSKVGVSCHVLCSFVIICL